VNPYINAADAFVAAWLPGSEGEGIADVLFGSAAGHSDFTGRLAFSWPQTAMPVTFDATGHVSGALFARGAGRSAADTAATPALPEDPQIPPQWAAPPGSLFGRGHVTAPWSVFVADDLAEVHLTTLRQESPRGAVVASIGPDGGAAEWLGREGGIFKISGRAVDLRARAAEGVVLQMRYRIARHPEHRVTLGVLCAETQCGTRAGAMLDLTQDFAQSPVGTWQTLSLPLACLSAAGADLTEVVAPFALQTAGHFSLVISDIGLVHGTTSRPTSCPREPVATAIMTRTGSSRF
jgi:beta-glucosidase